jgi:hypothetical protein
MIDSHAFAIKHVWLQRYAEHIYTLRDTSNIYCPVHGVFKKDEVLPNRETEEPL